MIVGFTITWIVLGKDGFLNYVLYVLSAITFSYFVYIIVYWFVPVNLIALLPSIFAAVVIYFTLVIKTGALSEEELKNIPKGGMIVRMAKKIHLL